MTALVWLLLLTGLFLLALAGVVPSRGVRWAAVVVFLLGALLALLGLTGYPT